MNREEALELLKQYVKDEKIIKHCLATEALMRNLAKRLNQDEEKWALAGLLHDLDWDMTKKEPEKHSLIAEEILKNLNVDPEIVSAIKIHNYVHGIEPQTLLEKALYSTEMITGFIVAVALVKPSKKLKDVTVQNLLEKFKEKNFAAGAKREIINLAPQFLGLSLEEIFEIALKSMQEISDDLGL
jgi:putative nucleotidyltransferase with HDIG domain